MTSHVTFLEKVTKNRPLIFLTANLPGAEIPRDPDAPSRKIHSYCFMDRYRAKAHADLSTGKCRRKKIGGPARPDTDDIEERMKPVR